MKKKLQ